VCHFSVGTAQRIGLETDQGAREVRHSCGGVTQIRGQRQPGFVCYIAGLRQKPYPGSG
jgi:hypothetical protein